MKPAAAPAPRRAARTVERPERKPLQVVIECAHTDDPEVLERAVEALADLLSGRLG